MPVGGVGYWAARYWHPNFWHPNYWGEVGAPVIIITPVTAVTLLARVWDVELDDRTYEIALVAQSPHLILPPRNYDIILPPRGVTMALSIGKQPAETYFYRILAAQYLPVGQTIASVELFVSRRNSSIDATVTSIANANATTLLISADPKKGSRILINALGPTAELVKVRNVTGTGPYTLTVVPALTFAHAINETVSCEPGFSDSVMLSTAPTVDPDIIDPHVTRGVEGHTSRVSALITLGNGDVIEAEHDLVVQDL